MFSMQTANERIKRIVDELFNGNITEAAKATNISRTTISGLLREGASSPGFEVIRKMGMITPKINLNWLILGEGDMYVQSSTDNYNNQYGQSLSNQQSVGLSGDIIREFQFQIRELNRRIEEKDAIISDLASRQIAELSKIVAESAARDFRATVQQRKKGESANG